MQQLRDNAAAGDRAIHAEITMLLPQPTSLTRVAPHPASRGRTKNGSKLVCPDTPGVLLVDSDSSLGPSAG